MPKTYSDLFAEIRQSVKLLSLDELKARLEQRKEKPFTLVDVQTILRHASVTTTQIYTRPRLEDLIEKVLEHHARPPAPAPTLDPGYDAAAVHELLGLTP